MRSEEEIQEERKLGKSYGLNKMEIFSVDNCQENGTLEGDRDLENIKISIEIRRNIQRSYGN